MVPCNVLCLLHLPDQQRVICGCEDGTIRLHTLDGRLPPARTSSCGSQQQQSASGAQQARDAGGGLLPTVWTGMHCHNCQLHCHLCRKHVPSGLVYDVRAVNDMPTEGV